MGRSHPVPVMVSGAQAGGRLSMSSQRRHGQCRPPGIRRVRAPVKDDAGRGWVVGETRQSAARGVGGRTSPRSRGQGPPPRSTPAPCGSVVATAASSPPRVRRGQGFTACARVAPRTARPMRSRPRRFPRAWTGPAGGLCPLGPLGLAGPTPRHLKDRPGRRPDKPPEAGHPHQQDHRPGDNSDRRRRTTPGLGDDQRVPTAMAPVGPDTCTDDPPNTAATMPATGAVQRSGRRVPTPDAAPKPRARGRAKSTDRQPGHRGRPARTFAGPA